MNTAKKLSIRLEAVGGDKVRQEFKNIGSDGQKAFQRITQVITPANDNLKVLDNTAKAFNNTLKQAASLAGAYLGLRGLTNTFKSIVETNKEFERLSGSLKTVTGSAKAAKEAFTLIEDFATSTPFQLDEIVDSFIRLKAMGLEPSMEALTSYGNTASAFGKNILEFVSAVSRTFTLIGRCFFNYKIKIYKKIRNIYIVANFYFHQSLVYNAFFHVIRQNKGFSYCSCTTNNNITWKNFKSFHLLFKIIICNIVITQLFIFIYCIFLFVNFHCIIRFFNKYTLR